MYPFALTIGVLAAIFLLSCVESALVSDKVINSTALMVSKNVTAIAKTPVFGVLNSESAVSNGEADNKAKKPSKKGKKMKMEKRKKKKKKKKRTEPFPIVGPPGVGNGLMVASSIQEATIEVVEEAFTRANSSIRAIVYSRSATSTPHAYAFN